MWQTISLALVGGVLAGNGLPHFVRGITRQTYPCVLGNGPIPNLLAGWTGLVLAALPFRWAHVATHPWTAFGATAVGVLLIGLFHAGPGAIGERAARDRPPIGRPPIG